MMTPPQQLIDTLKIAVGLLNPHHYQQLRQDVLTVCDRLANPAFRIAVFGPFNYGKSTLLNAMLGERALPIDLIPTTGAAICVKYGETLQSTIRFIDGSAINETGTNVLKQFATLDDNRCMRDDVASVEVRCPHPFLQRGVELLDLPGTDDREAQEALVRNQLLTADLVVQVLDARKLMTLAEREQLRDWLLDRGITNVIFVVNFLNLLESDDQKQVYNRLRFVAESFRAKLPPTVSNLYRVDALPALRARLKGNVAEAQTTGLPTFEAALETIVDVQRQQMPDTQPQQLHYLVQQVQQALQATIDEVTTELAAADKQAQRRQIQQKAQALIQQGFDTSIAALREWLGVSTLLDRYHLEATNALQEGTFAAWETYVLKSTWNKNYQTVTEWVDKACDFFNCSRPADLDLDFPAIPELPFISPTVPPPATSSNSELPTAIAAGVGWMLGGAIGAAVLGGASYLLKQPNRSTPATPLSQVTPYQANAEVVSLYFNHFNQKAILALDQYEITARQVINYQLTEYPSDTTAQRYQLQLLETTLATLSDYNKTNVR